MELRYYAKIWLGIGNCIKNVTYCYWPFEIELVWALEYHLVSNASDNDLYILVSFLKVYCSTLLDFLRLWGFPVNDTLNDFRSNCLLFSFNCIVFTWGTFKKDLWASLYYNIYLFRNCFFFFNSGNLMKNNWKLSVIFHSI